MSVLKRWLVTAVLAAVGVVGLIPAPAAAEPTVRDFVDRQRTDPAAPGMAWAVVGPDGVLEQGTSGVDGDGNPITSQTPFLWGSVSKPVTATLLVRLAQAGELDLDAPVVDHLPEFRTADRAGSARITVRQLLTHTSGLPRGLQLTDHYDEDRRSADVLAGIADLDPVAAPGESFTYSSLNYVVAGAVAEQVTGLSYAEALRRWVLDPAGMDTVQADAGAATQALPPGHRYVLGWAVPAKSPIDPATVPAGYLVGSLDDATAFAQATLDGGPGLDDAERRLLLGSQVEAGDTSGYGLGWWHWQVPGGDAPMVWHGGAAPGYQAAIILLPERNRAVVVLQNAYGPFHDAHLLETAWGIAALLTGGQPQPEPVGVGYAGLLAGLALLLVLLAGLTWLTIRQARTGRGRRRTAVAGVVVGVVSVVGLLVLPVAFGVRLGQLALWAPDLAGLVYAGLTLAGVLLVSILWGLAAGVRVRRPEQRSQ